MVTINPDRLAELEEERRFLLRSINDLDREHAAGDVDAADYVTLRDGYVARAAAVLRSIDEGRAALAPRPARNWRRIAIGVLATVAVAVGAGWWVARSSGQRLPGQSMTGGAPLDEVSAKLTEARQQMAVDPAAAIALYQEVRELDANNVEARTYTAWLLAVNSRQASPEVAELAAAQALDELQAVTELDPAYPDGWCLLAVTRARFVDPADPQGAQAAADACLALNPPAEMRGLMEDFLGDLLTASPTVP
jgi:hypothetical protein